MRRRDPYNDPYGPYGGQGPYRPYGGYGGYRGYRNRRPMGGGGCARDACLIEGGCCLAESLGGNCLVLAVAMSGRLTATLVSPRRRGSGREVVIDAIHRYRAEVSSARAVPCCRFTPSCSAYAEEAVMRHGMARGSWLAVRRVLRCRPGGRRGSDPVPL